MRDSSLWLSISVRDRCCQHLEIRKAQSSLELGTAPSWVECSGGGGGDPPHLSVICTGATSTPKEGPQALARVPRLRGPLEGKLGGCCLQGGDFKGSLIPGDIFRHRSLLFYAADQSPELYK